MKVPFFHALAPTQQAPLFAIAQVAVLVIFIVFGWLGANRLHAGPMRAAALAEPR